MWLDRVLEAMRRSRRRVLAAGEAYGVEEILDAWSRERRDLVRMEVAEDPESTALSLAEGVSEVWGDVLGLGMPLGYYLERVARLAGWLGPLELLVTGAERDPKTALKLAKGWARIGEWTVAGGAPIAGLDWPTGTQVLGPELLALTREEAADLAEELLMPAEAEQLWRQSEGAAGRFRQELYQKLGFPPVEARPPATLRTLTLLRKRGLPHLALELAARNRPEAVPDMVEAGGRFLLEHGQIGKLWRLLDGLPETVAHDERVMLMRLSAAVRLGRAEALAPELRRYLEARPAPEVRALAADLFWTDEEERVQDAERAAREAATSCTLFHLGHVRLERHPEAAAAVLEEAVQKARVLGRPHEEARNLWALAEARGRLGAYRAAARVLEEATGVFTRAGLRDHPLWLLLAGSLSFYRALGVGALTPGVDEEEGEVLAEAAPPTPFSARFFLGLGEQRFRASRLEGALWAFRRAAEPPGEALAWVRAVRVALELEPEAARGLAKEAADRLGPGHPHARMAAALVARDPEGLAEVLGHFLPRRQGPEVAIGALALAALGVAPPPEAAFAWKELDPASVARVGFSGVPLALLGLGGRGLYLGFLGAAEAYLEGRLLPLSLRHREILALLLLQPRGLSGERLADLLYGERARPENVKPLVSRLRKWVDVRSQPYRLGVEVAADFLELKSALARGDAEAAAGLYRGALLPDSVAPGIVEERSVLEEAALGLALETRHPGLLWAVTRVHPDRLEAWEALLRVLDESDPRRAWVRARVKGLARDYRLEE